MNGLRRCTANACEQGRKPCPCPQACLVATDDTRADEGAGAVVWGVIALIVGMACVSAFGDTLMALARDLIPAAIGR
jgi:hypothetical protein